MQVSNSVLRETVNTLIEDGAIKLRLTAAKSVARRLGLDSETRDIIFISRSVDDNRYSIHSIENGETNPSDIKTYNDIYELLSVYKDIEVLGKPSMEELFPVVEKVEQGNEEKVEQGNKENVEQGNEENVEQGNKENVEQGNEENVEQGNKEIEIKELTQSEEIEILKKAILAEKQVEIPRIIHRKKIGEGCEKCEFTGWILDEDTGIDVRCDCQIRAERQVKAKETEAPKVKIKDINKLRLLIPLERRKDEFDTDISKRNIEEIAKIQNCKIYRYTQYIDTINTILGEIVTSGLKNSYIIGAPNGFGKTTFVYTAIKRLIAQNKKVVPYLPLIELAEKKVEYEARLLEKLKNPRFAGELRREPDEFIWKDFLEADVLFTFLSSLESKEIESATLSALVTLRANKGKPTVVCVSTSLNIYTNDNKLREYYWDDMMAYKNDTTKTGVDRLIHRSCFKRYNGSVQAIKGVDF